MEYLIGIFVLALFAALGWQYKVKPTIVEEPEDIEVPKVTNREKLYNVSKASLGLELTPKDEVPDSVACVSSFQVVAKKALGRTLGTGSALESTMALYVYLSDADEVEKVQAPLPGDIALCATGTSSLTNTPVGRGHVAIVGKKDWMSNNSYTGKWTADYTAKTWKDFFETLGGYKTAFFRLK